MMDRSAFGHSVTRGHQRVPGMMHGDRHLASMGRHGDTELAHVTPDEKAMLMAHGGAGTRNPRTGMPEYYTGGPGRSPTSAGISGSRGYDTLSRDRGGGFAGSPEVGGSRGRLAHLAALGGFNPGDVDRLMGRGVSAGMRGFSRLGALPMLPSSGFSARPALNPRTSVLEGQVRYNPLQALTGIPFGPAFTIAQGAVEAPGAPDEGGRGEDRLIEERRSLGRSLLNAVLGRSTDGEEPADTMTAPAPQTFTPFAGDPLTYGQPGGAPSHQFFRSA